VTALPGTTPWARLAVAAGTGLVVGALTQLGQGLLPGDTSQAANAISPWLLVAFLVASTMPRPAWAVVAAIITLGGLLVGYYALVQLRFGYAGSTFSYLFWGAGALAGGVVFGLAGWAWRRDPRGFVRALAIGLMAGVFVGDAIYESVVLGKVGIGVVFAIVGLALPAILGRSRADRLGGYVAIVPALALGALGYVVFIALYEVITGIG
jgi:hypothetical protein